MRAPLGALISASTADTVVGQENSLRDISYRSTCNWCENLLEENDPGFVATVDCYNTNATLAGWELCRRCAVTASHALELGRQVSRIRQKGGIRLYIGIERTGEKKELVSVVRWSPLEPLESASSAESSLTTSQ